MTNIDVKEVNFDRASVADPNGRVFWWQGDVYRGIKAKSVDLYRRLFAQGVIANLQDAGLIDTEITPLSLKGYDLILKHRTILFRSYCFEWCTEMFKSAALLTCDFNIKLAELGLSTIDAHCWNILFDGPNPKFVDFCSIISWRETPSRLNEWHREFQDFFLYPLYLMSVGQSEAARRLLFDLNDIINRTAVMKLLPRKKQLKFSLLDWHTRLFRFESRTALLKQLRKSVATIEFQSVTTTWSGYYDTEFPSFEPSDTWTLKHRSVFTILQNLRPNSLLDAGCNKGWYSLLAAKMGSSVVGLDTDEVCVSNLYLNALQNDLPVLPLVMNICNPSPACVRDEYDEYYPPAEERLKCEMVLALAIVHHLVFKQGLQFDDIVNKLSSFSDKWLLVEFVPSDDQYVSKWYTSEFAWYSIENFMSALKKVYPCIEIHDSFPAPRKLLLCSR